MEERRNKVACTWAHQSQNQPDAVVSANDSPVAHRIAGWMEWPWEFLVYWWNWEDFRLYSWCCPSYVVDQNRRQGVVITLLHLNPSEKFHPKEWVSSALLVSGLHNTQMATRHKEKMNHTLHGALVILLILFRGHCLKTNCIHGNPVCLFCSEGRQMKAHLEVWLW